MDFDKNRVFIIGEIGVNHNGDMDIARELIDMAKEAGVDAVKFQSFNPEKIKIKSAPLAQYQQENTTFISSFAMSMKLKLSYEDHIQLKKYCDHKQVEFISTAFDRDSADLLEQLGVNYHKIASGELTNWPLVKHIAQKNKPIILSTGMADLDEIVRCVSLIKQFNNREIAVLHCVSLYPADFNTLNLSFIKTLEAVFGSPIGYSDHSLGAEAGIAAVAMGARVIEKHITLDKNMEGPDHKASLSPEELRYYVQCIRNIEKAMGTSLKTMDDKELQMRNISRKSIVVEKDICAGDIFGWDNLSIKKPGTGIAPEYINIILGRRAMHDLLIDTILEWNMVGSVADVPTN